MQMIQYRCLKKLKTFKNLKTVLYITFLIISFFFLLEFEKKTEFSSFLTFFFDRSSHFLQFEKCRNQMYAKEHPMNLPMETTKVTPDVVIDFWLNETWTLFVEFVFNGLIVIQFSFSLETFPMRNIEKQMSVTIAVFWNDWRRSSLWMNE